MRVIIHDLSQQEFKELYTAGGEDVIVADNGKIHHCIGCFGCWIKTPGVCVLKDGYENMGKLLSKCSDLLIVSKCTYGSYSPFIKNVFDRSISYMSPFFTTINGETHHKRRYDNNIALSAYFYGENISECEKNTAKALVQANGINFYVTENNTFFYNNAVELKGIIG